MARVLVTPRRPPLARMTARLAPGGAEPDGDEGGGGGNEPTDKGGDKGRTELSPIF